MVGFIHRRFENICDNVRRTSVAFEKLIHHFVEFFIIAFFNSLKVSNKITYKIGKKDDEKSCFSIPCPLVM